MSGDRNVVAGGGRRRGVLRAGRDGCGLRGVRCWPWSVSRRGCGRCGSAGLTGLLRADAVRAHHLVVLVLDDVAVPDELAGRVELGPDAGDLTWVGDDGVLDAAFGRLGRDGVAVELDRLADFLVRV